MSRLHPADLIEAAVWRVSTFFPPNQGLPCLLGENIFSSRPHLVPKIHTTHFALFVSSFTWYRSTYATYNGCQVTRNVKYESEGFLIHKKLCSEFCQQLLHFPQLCLSSKVMELWAGSTIFA